MGKTPTTRTMKKTSSSTSSEDAGEVRLLILWLRKEGIAAQHVQVGTAQVSFTDPRIRRFGGGGRSTEAPIPTARQVQDEMGGIYADKLRELEDRMGGTQDAPGEPTPGEDDDGDD